MNRFVLLLLVAVSVSLFDAGAVRAERLRCIESKGGTYVVSRAGKLLLNRTRWGEQGLRQQLLRARAKLAESPAHRTERLARLMRLEKLLEYIIACKAKRSPRGTPSTTPTGVPPPTTSGTPSVTPGPTRTASPTPSPSATPQPSISPTRTPTPSPTRTPTPVATPTASPTRTPTPTVSPSASPSVTPSPGATAPPTPTAPPSSSIQLSVSTNRTNGPAPLAVAFDATGTTGLAGDDYVGATFIWDFGDGSGGTWSTTNKSENRSGGFISGHLYETPGTYVARVRVIDRNGNRSGPHSTTITVTDPLTTYTQTYCVAPGGTDTSCAAGGVALSSIQQVLANLAPNRRFLFRRDFQQSLSTGISISGVAGPVYFGAYGSGSQPRLTFTNTAAEGFFYIYNSPGLVIEDFQFVGPDGVHGVSAPVGLWIDSNSTLLNRVQISGFDRNIHYAGASGSPIRTGNFVTNSALLDAGYFSLTISGNFRLTTLLGNLFSDSVQGHIRVLESQKTFIGNNLFQDSFAIKSHSGNMVIIDNTFNGGTHARIAYGTGGGGTACDAINKINHLVESNLFLGVSSTYSGGVSGVNVGCGGNFVLRANAFINVGNAVLVNATAFESGFTGSLPVRVINNYSADDRGSGSASRFLSFSSAFPRTDVRNNVVYFPNLNFRDGDYTTVYGISTSDISNLTANYNNWYLPNSNGPNGVTPRLFSMTGIYPNQIGYSSTITAQQSVQYFGIIQPLAAWRALGLDIASSFSNPGALVANSSGLLAFPNDSSVYNAGDPTAPFYLDIYGRERGQGTAAPIGPFLP